MAAIGATFDHLSARVYPGGGTEIVRIAFLSIYKTLLICQTAERMASSCGGGLLMAPIEAPQYCLFRNGFTGELVRDNYDP